ncbi:MAG: YeeE/YedE family protein [Deltaproteobacteria bacterium]|nr:YeeE/YedE family protein [Deltaproteobacteria bacterium]
MKASLVAFASGIVFALGLGISGMTRPIKVIGFLDFAGKWDASLAFVMIGAIAVYFIAYRLIRRRIAPMLAEKFSVPERKDIDRNLIVGAAIFGAGWGLGGFCPGPAITSLASGAAPVAVFVIAMAAGIYLHGMLTGLSRIRVRPLPTPARIATDS